MMKLTENTCVIFVYTKEGMKNYGLFSKVSGQDEK